MRNYYIAGNWKMNKTPSEGAAFVKELASKVGGVKAKVLVAPSFAALHAVGTELKGTNIVLGAQNMAAEESGAHTGEVSPAMLKDLGVKVVILGHSERRAIYGETDSLINKKVKLALAQGFEVILCVGETLPERESGKAVAVTLGQLSAGLKDVNAEEMKNIVILPKMRTICTRKFAKKSDRCTVQVLQTAFLFSTVVRSNPIMQRNF